MNITLNALAFLVLVFGFSEFGYSEIQCSNLPKQLRENYNTLVRKHVAKIQEYNKLLTRQQESSSGGILETDISKKRNEVQRTMLSLNDFKKTNCNP